MPALNFQRRFAPKIKTGEKRQTIRAPRKHPVKVGDTLHLFTGMRRAGCERIGKSICIGTQQIILSALGEDRRVNICDPMMRAVDGEQLARLDGFQSEKEMFNWFEETHGLPFMGTLITWGELENTKRSQPAKETNEG